MIINVVAIGEQVQEKIVYRNTAQEGDLLCVSGDLGAAYIGLKILQREKEVFLKAPGAEIHLDKHTYIVERQLKPEARQDIIEYLNQQNVVPTSMIDISDGLSSEILHICKQSAVGCQLEESAVPIANETYDTALSLQIDPINCALSGGEDYELLFTINPKDKESIDRHHDISIIGEILDANLGVKLHTKGDNYYDLISLGWDGLRDT
jgi:thiamine-monophosphate kinase